MGSTRSGAALAGTGRGNEPDLLASAAALRWSRPDLTGALADHVLETAVAEDDRDRWLRAAGWAVHARSATGDGRVVACEVLDALSRWGGEPLPGMAAHRLRVELAVLAAAAGEVQGARGLLEPVMVGEVPAGLRADAYSALARCASEDSPADVAAALRRAESAWSDVAAPRADVGIAAVALVAAATARRAGRNKRAVERAAEGLERLDRGRGAAQTGTPSGHLSAALAAEWISALLDAGRLSEARTACDPWVSRLRENIRSSRQVARLRLTVARALATGPEADATDALEKAAVDATASDAPDLESVCHAALGALHEKSGSIDAALESMRLGVAAQLRDSRRATSFLGALRSVVPAAAAVSGTRSADRAADAADLTPRAGSSARSRSRSAHERAESLDRAEADVTAADPWSTGRWSTAPSSETERNGNGWGSVHDATDDPPEISLDSSRHGGDGRNGSRYDDHDSGTDDSSAYVDSGYATAASDLDRYKSDREFLDRYTTDRSDVSASDRYSFSSEWERTARGDDRSDTPVAADSPVDRFASDWSSDWSSSSRTDRAARGSSDRAPERSERNSIERNSIERNGIERSSIEQSERKSTERSDRTGTDRNGTERSERGNTERSERTGTNGRSRNGKSRAGADGSRSDRTETGGRRRRGAEPVEPVVDRRPLEMPEIDTNAEGWLESALAELDRVWGKPADPAPAVQASEIEPVPPAASDRAADGCTVVIDVAREGRRFAGRRARAVVRDLTERLADRLPSGARLRQDDSDSLSVVLPGWDQAEATQWMHRTLTGLLEGFTAAEDLVGAQLRAGVHDADGPVGAQLVQRLDAAPAARRADPLGLETGRSRSSTARGGKPADPALTRADDRWAELDTPLSDGDDNRESREGAEDRWPELGSPSRRDRDRPSTRVESGRHDARGRTPFRLEEHLDRGVERERVERAREDASRHRRPSDTGALPSVQPARNSASDTGSTRAATAERPGAADNSSTEGLGLADLLAGALAAYRGI